MSLVSSSHIISLVGSKCGFYPPPTKASKLDLLSSSTIPIPPPNSYSKAKIAGYELKTLKPDSVPKQKTFCS